MAAVAAGAAAPAAAKHLEPGDALVCGADRCRPVLTERAASALGRFIYLGRPPARVPAPRLGSPAYQLRFDNDYVVGIVSGPRLDRFLSYGVYLERFRRGRWYRLAPRAAAEVRRLAAGLRCARSRARRSRAHADVAQS